MTMTICGFILAAGAGTRMRPATLLRPKALLPFCGLTLLDLAMDDIVAAIPADSPIIVNACYLGGQVKEWTVSAEKRLERPISCSMETTLLNHGGGIRKGVSEFAPETDEILVRNVDVVTDFDLRELVRAHHTSKSDATVLLIDNNRPDGVSVTPDGTIDKFHSGAPGHTFAGIYILHRRILDFLTQNVEAPSIITAFERAAANGCRINALVAPTSCWWSDVGTYDEYIRAHRQAQSRTMAGHKLLREAVAEQSRRRDALTRQGVRCYGPIGLGASLEIAAGVRLHNVVLWDNVRLATPMLYSTGVICQTPQSAPPANAAGRSPAHELRESFKIEWGVKEDNLPKQGSGRKYCRVQAGERSLVWSAYEPYARWENSSFAAISTMLRSIGVRAPEIISHLPEKCELLCEDLGSEDLLAVKDASLRREYLLQAVEQIARLHTLATPAILKLGTPLQPAFTLGLYEWERDYFRERLLDGVLGQPELWQLAEAEHSALVDTLLAQPLVPLHRDFQSANIKIHDGKTWFIDFQGMRLGAAAYDLASLLYDPYSESSPQLRLECFREYRMQVQALGGTAPSEAILPLAAIQRLMQALGAYGKLWKLDGLEWYSQHIPAAARNMLEAAEAARLPGFANLARKILETATDRNSITA